MYHDHDDNVHAGKRLVDKDIVERILRTDDRRVIITPILFAEEQIGPISINLHLGTEFIVVHRSSNTHYDPLWSREEISSFGTRIDRIQKLSPLDCFVIHPKQFVLATTLEYIALPRDIEGRLDGRSVWARQGVQVHSTASIINPGSTGIITFELQNVEDIPIKLYPGMAVAQLSLYELHSVPYEAYDQKRERAKYLWDVQAEKGLFCEDKELRILRKQQLKCRT